ncbi:MAG: endonuclease III domain-containing protein, partial [Dehalococcoidia bacterium]
MSRVVSGSAGERRKLLRVFDGLNRMHGERVWHWSRGSDPFEVAVGAILVQNTSWSNAERALANLRAAEALTPESVGALDPQELARLVRPSGQYRQKARKLRELLETAEEAGGFGNLLALDPADLRQKLLATWGIGGETADAILLYAARRPSFVVDRYTMRLFLRLSLGPGPGAGPEEWKDYFEKSLGGGESAARQELWARYHGLVVLHCKHLCL